MKIKNIEPSQPNHYHLNKVWVNETLKRGVKIEKVKPSYPGQHWVELNNYHINKILGKKINLDNSI